MFCRTILSYMFKQHTNFKHCLKFVFRSSITYKKPNKVIKPYISRILRKYLNSTAKNKPISKRKVQISKYFYKFLLSSSLFPLVHIFDTHHCEGNSVDLIEEIDIKRQQLKAKDIVNIILTEIRLLFLAILCAAVVAIINIKIPLLLGDIINVLTEYSHLSGSSFMRNIRLPAVKLVAMYLAQGAWTFSYISLITMVGERIAAKVRIALFHSLLQQDIKFYDQNKTGALIDRLTSDVQDFKSSLKACMSQGLKALMQTVGCTVSMAYISPHLTLLMIIVLPSIVFTGALIGSGLRILSRRAQDQMAQAAAVAEEAIGNVRTVRAFAMEPKENSIYAEQVNKALELNEELGFGIAAFQGLTNIAVNGIVLAVLFRGGYLMSKQQLTAGDLMSFLVATQTIQKSLAQISVLYGQAVKGLIAAGRVYEFISLNPNVPLTGGLKIPYHSLFGDVEFKNVNFSYPGRPEQTVLKDFSLKIPRGHTVALVGHSGGGKSTAAVLLERFYDVTSGSITLDCNDIRDMDPSWLRGRAIGYINQEPVLFATSIMENIRYGKPCATDTEVMEAAEAANAHDFISKFPDGYQTIVGERGVALSGGQKQRIAIARALIKQPSVMILDEATSALDAESEKVVQEALERVSQGRTVVVIAHRLSTIRNADLIAVIADGKIIEKGNHTELWKKKGIYWGLVKEQSLHGDYK